MGDGDVDSRGGCDGAFGSYFISPHVIYRPILGAERSWGTLMALMDGIQTKASAKEFRSRLLLMAVGVCLAFGLLVARLYYVQIKRGEEFADRGRNNFIHKKS